MLVKFGFCCVEFHPVSVISLFLSVQYLAPSLCSGWWCLTFMPSPPFEVLHRCLQWNYLTTNFWRMNISGVAVSVSAVFSCAVLNLPYWSFQILQVMFRSHCCTCSMAMQREERSWIECHSVYFLFSLCWSRWGSFFLRSWAVSQQRMTLILLLSFILLVISPGRAE